MGAGARVTADVLVAPVLVSKVRLLAEEREPVGK